MIAEHPDRQALMDEVHARPVEVIEASCRLRRLVFVMPARPGAMSEAFERFMRFCQEHGHAMPTPASRQYSFASAQRQVTWEFHTEFVTVTWRGPLDDVESFPAELGLDTIGEGLLIGATRIDVIADETVPDRLLPGFRLPSLCLADIENGRGQVATDFVPDADSFTRFELAAGGLTPLRRSIIARRLLEIDTYRTMALLGLPLARSAAPDLRAIELELTGLMAALSDAATPESRQASLNALQALSVRNGQLSERLDYRFAAGRAYGDILGVRLAGLRERSTTRGSTLTHFLGNRVDPGLATCAAVEKRLAKSSTKIERAIELLNVRIGVDTQLQNAALLDNIARTARSQFLLQRTVEGLSVIAISYYMLGILSYVMAGPLGELHWDKAMALSLSAPFVVGAVWLMARHIRKLHDQSPPKSGA
ncbi:DUF3422 family protein [Devosia sp. Root635]|uniref:DUF3422 family protein n=1 Tax=Devosia sp. Root635 TaxID=1736575 RepID=UPI0006F8331C|nr:DUF3422 domain-containing protein [Devosia sp. Root635]KRA55888.1 hypothetical protein ASD80_00975 [Devosia sp. Root635]